MPRTTTLARREHFHPIFYGSFDWHSCVHGWWTLLTCGGCFRTWPRRGDHRRWQTRRFTPEKVAGELAYLDRPLSRGFERPYGWAWLLYLHLEAARHADAPGRRSSSRSPAPSPTGCATILPLLTYPIRVGTHFNTAFALVLSLEWAETFDPDLAALIRERAR